MFNIYNDYLNKHTIIMEVWKKYKDLIEVSNYGNVRSLDRVQEQNCRWGGTMMVLHKGSDLKPSLSKKTGYYKIVICNGKEKEYQNVHRLVALLFCEVPEHLKSIPINELQVDHLDGDKTNNICTNLSWKTPKENTNNPVTLKKWKEIISSKEYREKLSKSLRGIPRTDEWKKNIGKANRGKKRSEVIKKKISDRMSGNKHPNWGKHLSEKTRNKISKGNIGKHHTEEVKKKMSELKKGVPNLKLAKQVYQCTIEGILVKIWESMAECNRNGFSSAAICKCCKNKYNMEGNNTYSGFKWMYKEDYEKMLGIS